MIGGAELLTGYILFAFAIFIFFLQILIWSPGEPEKKKRRNLTMACPNAPRALSHYYINAKASSSALALL